MKLYYRDANTNQRMYFDVTANGEYLFTGDSSGNLLAYDISTGDELAKIKFDTKILNTVQVYEGPKPETTHPLLLTGCGERDFTMLKKRKIISTNESSSDLSSSEDIPVEKESKTNLMNIWKVDLDQLVKPKKTSIPEEKLDTQVETS